MTTEQRGNPNGGYGESWDVWTTREVNGIDYQELKNPNKDDKIEILRGFPYEDGDSIYQVLRPIKDDKSK